MYEPWSKETIATLEQCVILLKANSKDNKIMFQS